MFTGPPGWYPGLLTKRHRAAVVSFQVPSKLFEPRQPGLRVADDKELPLLRYTL